MDTDGNLNKESRLFWRIFNTRSHKENKIKKHEQFIDFLFNNFCVISIFFHFGGKEK